MRLATRRRQQARAQEQPEPLNSTHCLVPICQTKWTLSMATRAGPDGFPGASTS